MRSVYLLSYLVDLPSMFGPVYVPQLHIPVTLPVFVHGTKCLHIIINRFTGLDPSHRHGHISFEIILPLKYYTHFDRVFPSAMLPVERLTPNDIWRDAAARAVEAVAKFNNKSSVPTTSYDSMQQSLDELWQRHVTRRSSRYFVKLAPVLSHLRTFI
jgi:hypothetical protein